MCGILGAFSTSTLAEQLPALNHALDLVRHRGPDDRGVQAWLAGPQAPAGAASRLIQTEQALAGSGFNLFFGHRRLSIIDLSAAGRQPMSDAAGETWIVFNGEIYNYVDLRRELQRAGHSFRSESDTEVILAAYREWGAGCVERFVGMWAFGIFDRQQQRLLLSRDRFGIKPLHYFWDGRYFIFSSEIKQILSFPGVSARANAAGIYEYLQFGSFDHSEETFFAGLRKLQPGHHLEFDLRTQSLAIHRYYQPRLDISRGWTDGDAAARFRELFVDSVRCHLRSDVEVGSCLSGGLDSSSIICVMSNILRETGATGRLRTFSSHFEDEEANELDYVQEAIRAAGVNASFVHPRPEELLESLDALVWHQEEPFGSSSIFAQWAVFRLVGSRGVKVMLDGQGADEQLGGYIGFLGTYLEELRRKGSALTHAYEYFQITRYHRSTRVAIALAHLLGRRASSSSVNLEPCVHPGLVKRYGGATSWERYRNERPFGDGELLNNLLYQMTFHHNLPALLRYEDRNSMAFSVEARVPFLDHRLVEFVLNLPSDLKIRHGTTKYVMREAMRGILPEKIRKRVRKLGFATPERSWQIGPLKGLIEKALDSRELSDFVVADPARENMRRIGASGIADFAPWRWLNLYLWIKRFGVT
jgi:asparagine synthase (glutamine-hydrolysing)